MKHAKFTKILMCLTTALAITFTVGAAGACSVKTNHPEARITYKFNGKEYDVTYTLYRNMYPHTVQHFIELANAELYNGIVIHDYQTNDWITGGYSYDEDVYATHSESVSLMSEYFEEHSKEDAYMQLFNEGKLSASVYGNYKFDGKDNMIYDEESVLPTVMGEFYNNIRQEIDNGKLTQEYGCLKMFYYSKETTKKVYVTPTKNETIMADYKNNCATSLFALQTGTSSTYGENNYTVFAKLKSTKEFDNLVDAVRNYIRDNHGGTASEFYNLTEARVDNYENFSDKIEADKGTSVSFNAPKAPIIIKTVKITKY